MNIKQLNNEKVLTGLLIGGICLVTITVVSFAFLPDILKTNKATTVASPSPVSEITQAVPTITPIPLEVLKPSPSALSIPSASPSAKPTMSPSPKPTVTPTPKVSPSPSPSMTPSPAAAPDFVFTEGPYLFAGGNSFNVRENDSIKLTGTSSDPSIHAIKILNAGTVAGGKVEVSVIVDGKATTKLLDDTIDPGKTNEMGWAFDLEKSKGNHTVHIKINPDKKVVESDYSNDEIAFNYDIP